MKIIELTCITTLFAFGAVASSSNAATIRVDFTARVDSIYDSANLLQSQVDVGQTGSGFFQYNTKSRDTNADSNWGQYGPPKKFRFSLGDYTFKQKGKTGEMIMVNNQSYFGDTFYWASLGNKDNVPGAFDITGVQMELRQFESEGASVFSNEGLPESLSLNEFSSTNRYFSVEFSPGYMNVINMTVTAMSTHGGPKPINTVVTSTLPQVSLIPEPTTFALLVIAAGTLLMRRRSSRSEWEQLKESAP